MCEANIDNRKDAVTANRPTQRTLPVTQSPPEKHPVNPRVESIRGTFGVGRIHDSIDDDEMKEIDPDEHRETLGSGIPQHLAQQTGPKYVSPQVQNSLDEENATGWSHDSEDSLSDLNFSVEEMNRKGSSSSSSCMVGPATTRVLRSLEAAEADHIEHPDESSQLQHPRDETHTTADT